MKYSEEELYFAYNLGYKDAMNGDFNMNPYGFGDAYEEYNDGREEALERLAADMSNTDFEF